jgi:hypothetical protein
MSAPFEGLGTSIILYNVWRLAFGVYDITLTSAPQHLHETNPEGRRGKYISGHFIVHVRCCITYLMPQ